jgi:hypothetical protein
LRDGDASVNCRPALTLSQNALGATSKNGAASQKKRLAFALGSDSAPSEAIASSPFPNHAVEWSDILGGPMNLSKTTFVCLTLLITCMSTSGWAQNPRNRRGFAKPEDCGRS